MGRTYQFGWCGLFCESSEFKDGKFLRSIRCGPCGAERKIHSVGMRAWKELWDWAGLHKSECLEWQSRCTCGTSKVAGSRCQKCAARKRITDRKSDKKRRAERTARGICRDCGTAKKLPTLGRCESCRVKHNARYHQSPTSQVRHRIRKRLRRWGLSEEEIRLCEELHIQNLEKKRILWRIRRKIGGKT